MLHTVAFGSAWRVSGWLRLAQALASRSKREINDRRGKQVSTLANQHPPTIVSLAVVRNSGAHAGAEHATACASKGGHRGH